MEKNTRITSIFLTIIFVGIMSFFTLASMIKEDESFSENENRILAQKPEFTWEEVFSGNYMESYQEYVRDQFPWRDEMLKLKNLCERLMGKTSINGILICDDDYYIEAHEREN